MQQSMAIQHLLDEFEKLPGIGPKSAQRIVFWLLNGSNENAQSLADAIVNVKKTVHFCPQCFNYAEGDLCDICSDPRRDDGKICVVCEPRDITAIERTHEYNGLYHVLGGAISPMDGIAPDDLNISELIDRLSGDKVNEVIMATNPNVEGETTAIYISKLIKPLGVKVTKLASGLPVGGDLEYADEITLGRAIEARREI
ncbi:MAG: recombination mediator RecR [Coriobacteriales bacterium]|jgi:recombination protein RecR